MRKKWMKKTGAAILAAVMAMSVLAGCSGSGTGGGGLKRLPSPPEVDRRKRAEKARLPRIREN